jgi:signal transduction histidine kinase
MSASPDAPRRSHAAPLGIASRSDTTFFNTIRRVWSSWSLARQFFAGASIVLLPAMLLIGSWVANRIHDGVVHSAGLSAALYMENFVEPLVQELANGGRLSAENQSSLANLLSDTSIAQRVLSFKIWTHDGRIVASSRPDVVGKTFPPSAGLKKALTGTVVTTFDRLKELENAFEKSIGVPMLEVYIPLRSRGSDQIIAIGEFYERASDLKDELQRAQQLSWMVVAAVTLSMLSALFAIVRQGSKTIEEQKDKLEQRVAELTRLLAENQRLRSRAQGASARATESNERYLRRLGADLHDGPAQLISLALLRVEDGCAGTQATTEHEPTKAERLPADQMSVRTVLKSALNDIRNIAAGLAVPEIEALSFRASMRAVVERHEQLTGTTVELHCEPLPPVVPSAVKLCAYRFVQEGLANAHRHAGGLAQTVGVRASAGSVVLTVSDQGGGIDQAGTMSSQGQGLSGLTDRIESIGGTLQIERLAPGTRLTAILPLVTGDVPHA